MNRLFLYFFSGILLFTSCAQKEKSTTNELFVSGNLEVTLWASSPMLNNPTNMDVDIKGRLWITEAVNYRSFANNDSFFMYRAKGDRIMILEDTDKDGKADSAKVFVQDPDLLSPVGIAVLGNKVVVSCSPNLIVYTDENGDDVPDKKEILLTGFGGKDHDHSLHAVYGGPDGNWYFNAGNAGPHIVTDKSGWTLRSGSMYTGGSPYNDKNEGGMKSDDGKVWTGGLALRVSPEGKNLKVLGHNFRNSYEVIPDSYGNLWQNDNDDEVLACRVSWLMEGGNAGYFSADGTRNWKADQRPGQSIPTAHWHQEDPGVMPLGDISGAGAPTGITMIEGDELGENYRGTLLSADAGRNIIFEYHPSVRQSGYTLGERKVFCSSLSDDNAGYIWNDSTLKRQQDKWFRPSDVTIGTDGAIYIADWYDPVVGGHLMQDSTGFGRIYRITRKDKKMVTPEIDLGTIEGQIEALKSPAINVRYSGYVKLKEQGDKATAPLKALLNDKNPFIRARAVWLLPVNELEQLLSHNDALIRATAYRALKQSVPNVIEYAKKMVNDESPFVQREVAVSLIDVPYEQKKDILFRLIAKCRDEWMLQTIGTALKGNESDAYREIKNTFASDDNTIQKYAWLLHPAEAINDLQQAASDNSTSTQNRLKAVTGLGFVSDKKSIPVIEKLTSSPDTMVAKTAKFWLGFKSPSSIVAKSSAPPVSMNASSKTYLIRDVINLKPDVSNGTTLFNAYCRTCHKVQNNGANVGPDLTYTAKKFDDEQLMKAIIFPSSAIAFGYQPWMITTKNKSTFYGFLVSNTKDAMILRDLAEVNYTILKKDILSAEKQNKSPMPEAGQFGLNEQQLRDITGYLKSVAD
ncbi:MAG: c-type cytochrome [Chitinophagaceae bacterium]|nr:c-type cytochrome [Chitinophagaceae bacterium]